MTGGAGLKTLEDSFAVDAPADVGSNTGVREPYATPQLLSRSAQALFVGAGFVTVMNSWVSSLDGVNIAALRVTGLATMAASLLVPFLPWRRHGRLVSWTIVIGAIALLVGSDQWHHYSRDQSAIAVYPVFFIVIIAWAGLTQPRGTAVIVAALSGVGLAVLLESGGHSSAAWQCIAVTVPAAAMLGEVISWTYGRTVQLGRLDATRRATLEALVAGASQLQGALKLDEAEAIVVAIAAKMFPGSDSRFEAAEPGIDDGMSVSDVCYHDETRELEIRLRGQAGILGTVIASIERPDAFVLDAARLYSQHIGSRLEQLRVIDALNDAETHDALTGIGNRRVAQDSVANLRPGDAVFLLDLDHFKAINDRLGHQAGDTVLKQFGDHLRAATRATDMISRYGGEEFLLVSPDTSEDVAALIADRLLDGWRTQRPLVTFSIGYTIHVELDCPNLTLEHADMALYQAKREGRDRAVRYEALTSSAPTATAQMHRSSS